MNICVLDVALIGVSAPDSLLPKERLSGATTKSISME
jgi:hypothetical protein